MSVTVATLKSVVTADISGLSSGLKKADDSLKTAKKSLADFEKRVADMADRLNTIGQSLSIGVTAPLVALGKASVDAATRMDSLKRGLTAVAGSSKEAEIQLRRLKEVAKLPGLGFEEAVQGSIRLQAAGISAKQAEASLKAFGNALATVGKGKAELDGVTLALGQMASKGKVFAEEINQINERVPQIRRIMIDAFGTADTEILGKAEITSKQFVDIVTRELEKLPKVTGGLKNSFENAQDSINESLTRIGDALAPLVAQLLGKVVPAIERFTKSFSELPKETQEWSLKLLTLAAAGGPIILLTGQIIELGKAIGFARLAALGPVVAIPALIGASAIAGIGAMNAESARKEAAAGTSFRTDLEAQLKDIDAKIATTSGKIANAAKSGLGPGLVRQFKADLESLEKEREIVAARFLQRQTKNEVEYQQNYAKAQAALRKQQAEADAAAAKARKQVQDALNAKARAEAEKRAREAAAEAERLRTLNASVQDDYMRLTKSRYDYERYRANQEYQEVLRDGANRVLAHKRLMAQLKDITFREMDAITEKQRVRSVEIALPSPNRMGPSDLLPPVFTEPQIGDIAAPPTDIRRNTPLGRPDRTRAVITEPERNAMYAQVESMTRELVQGARRASRNFLRSLFGDSRERGQVFRRLFDDLKNGLINSLIGANWEKAVLPFVQGVVTKLGGGLKEVLSSVVRLAETSVGRMLSAVYSLLAVANRRKSFGIGSVLGGIAGFALGGFGGAVSGYNIGNALDNGDVGGAIIGGVTAYASGTFGRPGGGPMNGNEWAGNSSISRSRSVQVNYNGPMYVNERADVQRVSIETVRRLRLAIAAGSV